MAEPSTLISGRAARRRIAVISMHTSPTASLGQNANGGLNVYVHEVCSAFSDRGIATDVYTGMQSRDDPTIEMLAPLSRVVYLPAGNGLDKYSLINEVPAFAARLRAFAAAEGISYDLLFSHYWLSGEVACILRPQLATGWAHVAHTLGLVKNRHLATGASPEPAMRIGIEGEIAQQADLLIASTADEGDELINSYGADPDHVFVVPPGVDLSTFRPLHRTEARRKIGYTGGPLILFVGRLERLKGVEIAIRALALLKGRAHPGLRLLVLGEDARQGGVPDGEESEKERLKAIASALGVRDQVDFVGSVAHHELPYFYSAADVCVMPSYSESFGLVGLEAQACGCPVVASDVPGLRSVVRDGVSGFLIEGDDPVAYADRIGHLLSDPELARQMGLHGSLLAQRFSWTRTADRLETLFDRVIDSNQTRREMNARGD
ncbi:MAG TPA: glycosyltransferase [Candidatus Dormibacteraeota bacterium]|nr:glycosyltransferase [Candidatus Dormibacteraeota bacterium]